jgi:hypothetical protein
MKTAQPMTTTKSAAAATRFFSANNRVNLFIRRQEPGTGVLDIVASHSNRHSWTEQTRPTGHDPFSPPLIKYVKFDRHRHTRPLQISNCADNIPILHVAAGIIVQADGENAWMLTAGCLHNKEIFKVVVVLRENKQGVGHRVQQPGRRFHDR